MVQFVSMEIVKVIEPDIIENLPGMFGEQGQRAIISGEQWSKGQILSETAEQRQNLGTENIKKIDFVLHCQANKGSYKLWKKNPHKPNIHSVRQRQIKTDRPRSDAAEYGV